MASCLLPLMLLVTVGETDLQLVYFTASWCQPCKQMQPTLDRLSTEDIRVHVVDADQQPQAIRDYRIENLPTLVFVSGNREVDRMVGVANYDQVRRRVDRALARFRSPAVASARETPPRHQPTAQTDVPLFRGQSPRPVPKSVVEGVDLTAARSAPTARPEPAKTGLTPAQAVAKASAATVRIRVDEGKTTAHGTGTIVDVHGQEALVLTCGHLFRDMQPGSQISVDLFAGTPNEVNRVASLVDFKADETDIGLISFKLPVAIEPVAILPPGEEVVTGQEVFSYGCDHGADPTRRDTRVTSVNRYLGAANLEIEGAPAVGRSGGGLFDLQGRLVGVCNAADANDDRGIYAGAKVVYDQIERLGLAHLFQSSPEPAGSRPPAEFVGHQQPVKDIAQQESLAEPANTPPWPDAQLSAASLPTGSQAASRELICIMRDAGGEHVVTIKDPSPELLQHLQNHH